MRILALGDVVGKVGRQALRAHVQYIRSEFDIDFVIANGENSAGGVGITNATLDEILSSGVDCVTGGNHSWKNREIYSRYDKEHRVLRPANYPEPAPGHGEHIYSLNDGRKVAVLNLQGLMYMQSLPCPFEYALNWVETLPDDVCVRIVDFHAEATSEKKALSFALDGKVSLVFGTHTHVQTADAQILPQGTGYMTDIGMCGVEQSCLGMEAQSVVDRFISKRPVTFKRAVGEGSLNGVIVDINDETGMASHIQLFRRNTPRTTNVAITIAE